MNLERYPVVADSRHLMYKFLSKGPNGPIRKIVFYREIDNNVFNLEFGDWDGSKQEFDDKARSNNNKDPVFIKKGEEAKEFLKKNGLPESFKKKS